MHEQTVINKDYSLSTVYGNFSVTIQQDSLEVNPSVLIGFLGFCHKDPFLETVIALELSSQLAQAPYNKPLTSLACLSHTREIIGPLIVKAGSLLCLVHTATTLGQYCPRAQSVRDYYSIVKI